MKSLSQNSGEESAISAIAFAGNLARFYCESGGNAADLFAAFVGIVVEKDKKLGLAALEATDRFLTKARIS